MEEEDLDDALKILPMTGAEIVAAGLLGGWEDLGITDSAQWIEEQRRKRCDERLGSLIDKLY